MATEPESSKKKRKHGDDDSAADHRKHKRRHGHKKSRLPEPTSAQSSKEIQQRSPDAFVTVKDNHEDKHPLWTISAPIGGKFVERDPIFTPDEKYFIFATESAVKVYTTSGSDLVQSLHATHEDSITCYALSALDPSILWAATYRGIILKWNLNTGIQLGSWRYQSPISYLKSTSRDKQEIIFTLDVSKHGWKVTAHSFSENEGELGSQNLSILDSKAPISSIKAIDEGRIIAAITMESILIGTVLDISAPVKKLQYTWREIKCKEPPICFELRASEKKKKKSKKQKNSSVEHAKAVDIVIGGAYGCIYLYEDMLNRLNQLEDPSGIVEGASLSARAMHWHRERVGAVAWSKDGNYVISGGKETVLVLWQLETAHKQFLPNLESPIQSIVVSPSGTSYAVRLGDNSIMLLSTSELSPTAYVAGLQSTSFSRLQDPELRIRTVELTSEHQSTPILNHIAAAVDPKAIDHLLIAVPTYQTTRVSAAAQSRAAYVQNFDLSTDRHEARQAVTRTNAITSNLGPEGNRIYEPEVVLLETSFDGRWLATVDEWTMPSQDVKKLAELGDIRTEYKESRLRIWSWNLTEKNWNLNTVMENPHKVDEEIYAGSVLDLTFNPVETKFATIGTDSILRVWAPRTKTSRGKVVLAKDKQPADGELTASETWWAVEHTIFLHKSMSEEPLRTVDPSAAKLCYSNDASILAAYQYFERNPAESAIYLVDAGKGLLRQVQQDFAPADARLHAMEFLERYLICLSYDSATVWDVTTYEMHAFIPLDHPKALKIKSKNSSGKRKARKNNGKTYPLPHMAVNPSTATFAIAMPQSLRERGDLNLHPLLEYQTDLLIFSPKHGSTPVFRKTLPRLTSALLGAGGMQKDDYYDEPINTQSRGYIVVDVGAEARTVLPSDLMPEMVNSAAASNGIDIQPENQQSRESSLELKNSAGEGSEDTSADSSDESDEDISDITKKLAASLVKEEPSMAVVPSERLAEVFDQPTHAMPTMNQLFQSVFKLYAEPPKATLESTRSNDEEGAEEGNIDDEQDNEAADAEGSLSESEEESEYSLDDD